MKKIAFALILSSALLGCQKNGPERSAEIFLNGLYHMDFDAAESVATSDTKGVLKNGFPAVITDGKRLCKGLSEKNKDPHTGF